MQLLTYGNTKVMKGEKIGYLTAILHLAPSRLSGFNVCPMASKGCIAGCLNTAGRGIYSRTQEARKRKTLAYFNDRAAFMAQLVQDVQAVERKAARMGMVPTIRLNGTSDLRWEYVPTVLDGVEYPNIMTAFPTMLWYDYSKIPNRRDLPENYHITFSRSESNQQYVGDALSRGMNVAMVFRKELPKTYMGYEVIDGTETDLRFLDPKNVIVGLVAKGKARRDMSGFVIDV